MGQDVYTFLDDVRKQPISQLTLNMLRLSHQLNLFLQQAFVDIGYPVR
jgi:hypothetical protein